jgi:hypothetical protein
MTTDVSELQLLPEIQNTTRSTAGDDEMFIPTCAEPICIFTYCPVPQTVIG